MSMPTSMVQDDGSMVSVRGLYKRFKDLPVLLNLSFDIPRGKIFGYIGPNGAGKTTTIKIMTGLIHDFQGDVIIEGRSIRQRDASLSSLIGYLPQQTALQEWRTVDQTLRTFGRLSGLEATEVSSRIDEVTQMLGITEYRGRKVSKLSGGTLQKVGMAQAMLHRPKLMVLDEPVAGLDPESRVLFKQLFRRLSREGTTVFFSSHILSDIEDIADTIGILGRGRMRYIGSMEELRGRVGRNTEVLLETVEPMPDNIMFQGIPHIDHVERITDNRFQMTLQDQKYVDLVVDRTIKAVLANGRHVRGIYPTKQSLESLYLSYIGSEDEA
ncbi:MAG: ABC transporter ATP-binding protein [Methanomassiliicoccales archaeon]|nr:ABC transporter ATP-binding protein [Methanomassiliicoccales archaeon]